MSMVAVTVAFVALSALSIAAAVRRERALRSASGTVDGHSCPRCGTLVRSDEPRCPQCGVPQQAFELHSAPLAAVEHDKPEADGPLRAHVRADICAGCGACVAACPEEGAIFMRGKLAVVDPARCTGHGECATACPFGAITMSQGAAANRVVVPALDAHFQTTKTGIYIVGELGGRGLIKNAINEGKIAIEHVHATRHRLTTDDELLDAAIVGAGPAGLSAGLEAARRSLRYVVLEQGTLAESVRQYPRHKLLLAEPVGIPLYGDLWIADASKESLLRVWERAVERAGLRLLTGQRVDAIERTGSGYRLTTTDGSVFRARCVVLAMGRRGTPRRLGVPGEDGDHVFYNVAEMEDFAGRRVLVVGGGDSALETAVGLANQPNTTVTLSYRGDAFERAKARNRDKLAAVQASNRVTVLLGSTVREIRNDVVVLDVAGEPHLVPVDDVIVRVGGDPPQAMLDRLGVTMVQKDLPLPTPEAVGA